jgi:hypothetical protein
MRPHRAHSKSFRALSLPSSAEQLPQTLPLEFEFFLSFFLFGMVENFLTVFVAITRTYKLNLTV